jgi:hypothetical protein
MDYDPFLGYSYKAFIHRLYVLVIGIFFLLHLLKAALDLDVGIARCRSLSVIRILLSVPFFML